VHGGVLACVGVFWRACVRGVVLANSPGPEMKLNNVSRGAGACLTMLETCLYPFSGLSIEDQSSTITIFVV